jgi:hypothetical protein
MAKRNYLFANNSDINTLSTFIKGNSQADEKLETATNVFTRLIEKESLIKSSKEEAENSIEILSENEFQNFANKLKNEIESFPRLYTVHIPLATKKTSNNIDLGNDIKITNFNSTIASTPSAHLEFIYHGTGSTGDAIKIEEIAGRIIYIARAIGILTNDFKNLILTSHSNRKFDDIFTVTDSVTKKQMKLALTTPTTNLIRPLCIADISFIKNANLDPLTLASKNDPHSTQINNAIKWAIDAERSHNTFGVIQTAIALEALFSREEDNDSNFGSIKKVLASRCAYSIGLKKPERDDIYKTILNLYSLRNAIVHGEKTALTKENISILHKSQAYLKSSLIKEITMPD